jgi:KaiC/GvpD/RAD55 family RecA-like ATPase
MQFGRHGAAAGQASEEGSAKASDAIPKRRSKESIKTTILFFSS